MKRKKICTNFKGCCTYPIGGYVAIALLVSTLISFSTTIYSVVTCKFIIVEFTSDTGDFETTFLVGNTAATSNVRYKTAVGLFQWLRPINTTDPNYDNGLYNKDNWNIGSCVGYQETMLDALQGNIYFNMSRMVAILAVVISVVVTLSSFLSACIDWNRIQIYLLAFLHGTGCFCTAMTFVFHKSSLCTTAFVTRSCTMGNGGLLMIASSMMWFVSFLISIVFIHPTTSKRHLKNQPFSSSHASSHKSKKHQEKRMKYLNKQSPFYMTDDEKREKANIQRQLARDKTGVAVSSPERILQSNSYSFDSQDNWHKPIPSRSAIGAGSQPHQHNRSYSLDSTDPLGTKLSNHSSVPSSNHSHTRSVSLGGSDGIVRVNSNTIQQQQQQQQRKVLVIDDVTDEDAMEVYIHHKLNKIHSLTAEV